MLTIKPLHNRSDTDMCIKFILELFFPVWLLVLVSY